MIQGEVIGADVFQKAIHSLSNDIKRGIMDVAFAKASIPVYHAMRELVGKSKYGVKAHQYEKKTGKPIGHPAGNLQRSIRILPYKETGAMYPTFWVKPVKNQGDPDGWYAKFLEYGHFTKVERTKGKIRISKATKKAARIKVNDHVRWVPPHPFIRPAYDKTQNLAMSIIKENILNKIEEYITG
jgi:hypothetical protein